MNGYEAAVSKPYDFDLDPRNIGDTQAIARELVGKQGPINGDRTPKQKLHDLLAALLTNLRKLVTENKLSELLFNDDGSPRREVMSQRLIYAISEIFARLYDVDVNREPNAGNGPVDFKFSVGRQARVLIEVKLSNHPRLADAYRYQLPAYGSSEDVQRLILLIIQVDDSDERLDKLRTTIQEGHWSHIQLEIIDARRRPSASKRSS